MRDAGLDTGANVRKDTILPALRAFVPQLNAGGEFQDGSFRKFLNFG